MRRDAQRGRPCRDGARAACELTRSLFVASVLGGLGVISPALAQDDATDDARAAPDLGTSEPSPDVPNPDVPNADAPSIELPDDSASSSPDDESRAPQGDRDLTSSSSRRGDAGGGVLFQFEAQPAGTALVLVTDPIFRTHTTVAQGLGPAEGGGVRRVPRRAYRTLCTSPCRGELPIGIHTFGLRRPSGDVWVALPPLSFQRGAPMRINGYAVDHAGERLGGPLFLAIGGLAGLGGVLGGMAMMISSQNVLETTEGLVGLGVTVGSGVLMLLALAIGLPLTFYVDRSWVVGLPLE